MCIKKCPEPESNQRHEDFHGFGATQQLGETDGIYIGYNLDTGINVYLKPSLAAQGVKGSVTNALAAAFLGSLGGGTAAFPPSVWCTMAPCVTIAIAN